jgi:hypothetical protein
MKNELLLRSLRSHISFSFRVTDGASGINVDVSPRNPIVRVGQNFTFMCRVGKQITYCGMKVPGYDSRLIMSENAQRNNKFWYTGDGFRAGQCGITISQMDDKQNGQFKCSLAVQNEQTESDGITNVTVASKN